MDILKMMPVRRAGARALLRITLAVIAVIAAMFAGARIQPIPSHWNAGEPAAADPTVMRIVDRNGHPVAVMREVDHPFIPVALDQIDRRLVEATTAAEDRRFFMHPGVDPAAIVRAAWQNLRECRLVSGGSTLTQQLVDLMEDSKPGSGAGAGSINDRGASRRSRSPIGDELIRRPGWGDKLRTAWLALALETRWSKEEILEAYFNHAPYGADLRGVRAACRAYFGHDPDVLTIEEAALLAALPQSPVRLDPRRHPDEARAARNRVLARMEIDQEARGYAEARSLGLAPAWSPPGGSIAPHWVAHLAQLPREICEVRLPLDGALQTECASALQEIMQDLAELGADAGGVVVIHNATCEVHAWVGSPDWRHPGHGQVDGTRALRQPGSALKPFAYALAFERGLHPSSILPDLPISHPGEAGVFRPRNYSGAHHGPVRARMALANSWNAPAVALLSTLSVSELLSLLLDLGLESLNRPADEYGLGLVLGVGEVTLADLTTAYACLARGGVFYQRIEILEARDASGRQVLPSGQIPPQATLSGPAQAALSPFFSDNESRQGVSPRRVLDPEACYLVSSILSDEEARSPAFGQGELLSFPYPAAIKTGTSSDWRDNWAFGFTQDWTAGVWVGAAEGTPMNQISGTIGALQVLRRVLDFLHVSRSIHAFDEDQNQTRPGRFSPPPNLERRSICTLSGMRAGPHCQVRVPEWFHTDSQDDPVCDWHQGIEVDAATGLLARPCTPRDRVREVTFVRSGSVGPFGGPPGLFDAWIRDEGWRTHPHTATPCACLEPDCGSAQGRPNAHLLDAGPSATPTAHGDSRALCKIWNPVDGSIYIIDPTLPLDQQAIALEGGGSADALVWHINGEEYARASPGSRVFWRLQPGRHEIVLKSEESGDAGIEDTVRILVQEDD